MALGGPARRQCGPPGRSNAARGGAPPRHRDLGARPADRRLVVRLRSRPAPDPGRRLHPRQRVRRPGDHLRAAPDPAAKRRPAVAGAGAQPGRRRRRHAPERRRRRPQPQLPVSVEAHARPHLLLRPASRFRAGDAGGDAPGPPDPARGHHHLSSTHGPRRRIRRRPGHRPALRPARRPARDVSDLPAGRGDRMVQPHPPRHDLVRRRAARRADPAGGAGARICGPCAPWSWASGPVRGTGAIR